MRVLVTGGSGFIGRAVSKALAGHEVVAAGRTPPLDGSAFLPLEGLDARTLAGFDAVVHLAARVHQMKDTAADPLAEHRRINRDLTLKLADAALKAGVAKFIFASTVKVMGEGRPHMEPLTEKAPYAPDDPYGVSKMEAEQGIIDRYAKQDRCQAVILRIPMVYGPGNKGNMLQLLNFAARRLPLPLGAARSKRSMVYIGNLADAFKIAVERTPSSGGPVGVYFVNDGHDLTSGELYAAIFRAYNRAPGVFNFPVPFMRMMGAVGSLLETVTGRKLPLNRGVVSRLYDEYRFSAAAFMGDYGWMPPVSPEEGIRRTVEWHCGGN